MRGRAVGLRGHTSRQGVQLDQRLGTAGAPVTAGGVRGAGQARLNVRGTQRGKPLQSIPGEPSWSVFCCKSAGSLFYTAFIY